MRTNMIDSINDKTITRVGGAKPKTKFYRLILLWVEYIIIRIINFFLTKINFNPPHSHFLLVMLLYMVNKLSYFKFVQTWYGWYLKQYKTFGENNQVNQMSRLKVMAQRLPFWCHFLKQS